MAGMASNLDRLNANEEEALKLLGTLNKHESTRPNGIHPAVVQTVAGVLYRHVAELYKVILRLGEILAE